MIPRHVNRLLAGRLPLVLSLLRFSSAARSSPWQRVAMAPPDKILGLTEAFKADPFPSKVDLGVGAYRDENGKPFVLESVREAERRILARHMDHEYAGIGGIQNFVDHALEFAYGDDCPELRDGKIAGMQSVSGTGACRVAAEFIAQSFGTGTKVYLPTPTWPNHVNILKQSGLSCESYPYYDASTKSFNFDEMMKSVASAPEQSVFLLHACAHNPTGCDPTSHQWDQISAAMKAKNHVVIMDCAYQGFASGNAAQDAYSLRKFVKDGHNLILCQSFAKNFGLYGERIGAVSVVASSVEEKQRVLSQLKQIARPMYSNPPIHGARIVNEILSDPKLKEEWLKECFNMAMRIKEMRKLLQDQVSSNAPSANFWDHITNQIGMFCYTGLTRDQVLYIREKHHVYFTDDGRISMAGLNSNNVRSVAAAFQDALRNIQS